MRSILIVICARAGSKGVKHKNIRPLLGKPLIGYTIETALQWNKAAHVIVSTDSSEISDVALEFSAEAPFKRPPNLASDHATKGDTIFHALQCCEEIYNKKFKIIIDLDVTAPLRTVKDLDNCLDIFLEEKPKTLFSVVEANKNPYFNMVKLHENGYCSLVNPFANDDKENYVYRRQDAPVVYSMNASIYFYDRSYLLSSKCKSPFTDKTCIYEMDEISGIDIDTELDFQIVEFLMGQINKSDYQILDVE